MTDPTPQAFVAPLTETNGTFWTVGGLPVPGKLVAKNKRSHLVVSGFLEAVDLTGPRPQPGP